MSTNIDYDLVSQNLNKATLSKVSSKASVTSVDAKKDEQLKEACAGFEAIFLNTVLKSMRDSLPGDSLFGESNGTNIYKSMYDQYLSDHLAAGQTSMGLKEFLYNQLKSSV